MTHTETVNIDSTIWDDKHADTRGESPDVEAGVAEYPRNTANVIWATLIGAALWGGGMALAARILF